eukprot:6993456-Prymnesium_polylepis.1
MAWSPAASVMNVPLHGITRFPAGQQRPKRRLPGDTGAPRRQPVTRVPTRRAYTRRAACAPLVRARLGTAPRLGA